MGRSTRNDRAVGRESSAVKHEGGNAFGGTTPIEFPVWYVLGVRYGARGSRARGAPAPTPTHEAIRFLYVMRPGPDKPQCLLIAPGGLVRLIARGHLVVIQRADGHTVHVGAYSHGPPRVRAYAAGVWTDDLLQVRAI